MRDIGTSREGESTKMKQIRVRTASGSDRIRRGAFTNAAGLLDPVATARGSDTMAWLPASRRSIKRDEIDGSCREVNRQRALNYLRAAAIAASHRGNGERAGQLRNCHAARRG